MTRAFSRVLVVTEKCHRVAAYANGVIHEVETIAHSVGVREPRLMRRRHVRIMGEDGVSVPMNVRQPSYGSSGNSA